MQILIIHSGGQRHTWWDSTGHRQTLKLQKRKTHPSWWKLTTPTVMMDLIQIPTNRILHFQCSRMLIWNKVWNSLRKFRNRWMKKWEWMIAESGRLDFLFFIKPQCPVYWWKPVTWAIQLKKPSWSPIRGRSILPLQYSERLKILSRTWSNLKLLSRQSLKNLTCRKLNQGISNCPLLIVIQPALKA